MINRVGESSGDEASPHFPSQTPCSALVLQLSPQERSRGDSFVISGMVSAPYFLACFVFRQSSKTEIFNSAIPVSQAPKI